MRGLAKSPDSSQTSVSVKEVNTTPSCPFVAGAFLEPAHSLRTCSGISLLFVPRATGRNTCCLLHGRRSQTTPSPYTSQHRARMSLRLVNLAQHKRSGVFPFFQVAWFADTFVSCIYDDTILFQSLGSSRLCPDEIINYACVLMHSGESLPVSMRHHASWLGIADTPFIYVE